MDYVGPLLLVEDGYHDAKFVIPSDRYLGYIYRAPAVLLKMKKKFKERAACGIRFSHEDIPAPTNLTFHLARNV